MDEMKKLVLAAVAAISLSGAAHAGVVCDMHDTRGNSLTYAFGSNTVNTNGSFGGTMVETAFRKNGTNVISDVGQRPVWVFGGNVSGGYNLYSRAAPGWSLSVLGNGSATLTHNGRFAGGGYCNRAEEAASQTTDVGDQGL
jgi:opacity protein-like surface antigen